MALIDTHKAVKEFVAVGMAEKQAEAITGVIARIDNKVATRADIVSLREITATKHDINLIRQEMHANNDSVRKEIELLRQEFIGLFGKIGVELKWTKAFMVAVFAMLIKIAFFN
jgi:hypothetical protein